MSISDKKVKHARKTIWVKGTCNAENPTCKGYNLYKGNCSNCSCFVESNELEDALNECFGHTLKYKGVIQVFPNALYHIDGKKVLELYKRLNI